MHDYQFRRFLIVVVLILLGFFADKLFAESFESLPFFSYSGVGYLNVTHSGLHGERYLLNKQLSTIQITTDVRPLSWGKFHSLLIYNKTPTPVAPSIYFDEAYLELSTSPTWSFVAGKKWLAFSAHKTDLIYKPLSKALGQTNETAIGANLINKNFYSQFSLFKPHSPIVASFPVQYSFNAGLRREGVLAYETGAGYISSIAESLLFQFNSGFGGFLDHPVYKRVGGVSLFANITYKQLSSYFSFTSANKNFNKQELSFNEHGARPSALSLQGGYKLKLKSTPLKVMIYYEESFQALALLLPKRRMGTGLNIYASKNLDLQFQIFRDFSYADNLQASGFKQKVIGSATIRTTGAFQLVFRF